MTHPADPVRSTAGPGLCPKAPPGRRGTAVEFLKTFSPIAAMPLQWKAFPRRVPPADLSGLSGIEPIPTGLDPRFPKARRGRAAAGRASAGPLSETCEPRARGLPRRSARVLPPAA